MTGRLVPRGRGRGWTPAAEDLWHAHVNMLTDLRAAEAAARGALDDAYAVAERYGAHSPLALISELKRPLRAYWAAVEQADRVRARMGKQ